MSPGPTEKPERNPEAFEHALVRPGHGLEASVPGTDAPLEGIVDRVLEEHKAVMASLRADVRVPLTGVPEGPAAVLRRERTALAALREDLEGAARIRADMEASRRERERSVASLRPTMGPVFREDPIVTRAGVLRVEADFAQSRSLGPVAEVRLFGSGVRTVRAFLELSTEDLMRVTGLPRDAVQRARDDLRLERVAGLETEGADLLRVVGVHTVTDLASRDPVVLTRRLDEVRARHRLARFPDVVASETGLARLVAAARALLGGV